MELDIPRGTLCSHAEASSLLSSKAGHLLTVSSLTAALRASGTVSYTHLTLPTILRV